MYVTMLNLKRAVTSFAKDFLQKQIFYSLTKMYRNDLVNAFLELEVSDAWLTCWVIIGASSLCWAKAVAGVTLCIP